MALRNPTEQEAEQVIFDSLGTVWDFGSKPPDPNFADDVFSWTDILELPPVNKTFLYAHTVVAAYLLQQGEEMRPSLSQKRFFEHVDGSKEETVADYRDFLMIELIIDS